MASMGTQEEQIMLIDYSLVAPTSNGSVSWKTQSWERNLLNNFFNPQLIENVKGSFSATYQTRPSIANNCLNYAKCSSSIYNLFLFRK